MTSKTILHGLFLRHYNEMLHLARTLLYDDAEAEDAVQDVFVRLMKSDILPADDKMKAYLMTAVRNGCLNRIRQKTLADKLRQLYPIDADTDWQYDDGRMQAVESIWDYAQSHLQEPHLTIFRLRFEEDLKLKDIASRLDMNLKTVFKYLSQSIQCIQKQFRT